MGTHVADGIAQSRALAISEHAIDDDKQIQIAATGKVVTEDQGAMQNDSQESIA